MRVIQNTRDTFKRIKKRTTLCVAIVVYIRTLYRRTSKVTGHEKVGRGYWRGLGQLDNTKRMRITRITQAIRHVLQRVDEGGGEGRKEGEGRPQPVVADRPFIRRTPSAPRLRAVAVQNDPGAPYAIMSVEVSPRWPCAVVLLLLVAAVSCSGPVDDADNVLPVDGFGNEEIKESNLGEFAYHQRFCIFALGTALKMFSWDISTRGAVNLGIL